MVGAGALVTPGTRVPPGSLVLGAPARVIRRLTAVERRRLKQWAEHYFHNAAYCRKHRINIAEPRPG
jgi:carbonic anhydrase/acetyltransferase-like protein (isoleucine patch superfamily)